MGRAGRSSRVSVLMLSLAVASASVGEERAGLGLGFSSRDLTRAERAEVSTREAPGALVTSVYPGGPAAAAGLLPMDRVVAVNDQPVRGDEGFSSLLAAAKRSGAVRLRLRRGAGTSDVVVVPAERLTYTGNACESGDGYACADLSYLYRDGVGVARDEAKARDMARRGCDLGIPTACSMLGSLLAKRRDGPADPAAGVTLVDKACQDAHAEACWLLGVWSEGGHFGLERSRALRASYHAKGCEAGDRRSCFELAKALEDGDGVEQDLAGAARAYEEACEREHDDSCINAARMSWAGRGVVRDRDRAYRLYGALCDRRIPSACFALGESLLRDGQGPRAAVVLQKGCDRGMEETCCLLGHAYEDAAAGLARDVPRAARLYRTACDAGHGHACFSLGFLYDVGPLQPVGVGLPHDESRAFSLYVAGCDRNYMVACWQAGLQLVDGEGVARDLERGRALLQKACDGGEPDACTWIENLALR